MYCINKLATSPNKPTSKITIIMIFKIDLIFWSVDDKRP